MGSSSSESQESEEGRSFRCPRANLATVHSRTSNANSGDRRPASARPAAWIGLDTPTCFSVPARKPAYALYAVLPEGEQILANLRQFFDRVRTLEADSALGLGRLARRLREQIDEFEKEGQANLAGDDDAVQIMTVHAAKGLEFPVVAVLKMEAAMKPRGPEVMVEDQGHGADPAGTLYVNVRHPRHPLRTFTCQGLDRLRKLDKRQELAEKRRLVLCRRHAGVGAADSGRRATKKNDKSWQSWFEDALKIEEHHRQAGIWKHSTEAWQLTIVRPASAVAPLEQPLENAIAWK